uniref:Uncharacterized protein n=1 Tax=Lactuca sativa TaxID=4236 RepID=A0A9R1V8M8_LACSA|nr:hypothetical protein LSAT_V11C600307810 [Lactuca sativa]
MVYHIRSFKSLLGDQASRLEMSACGSHKSPGPNDFTFAFFEQNWDLIRDEVMIPFRCNSSFIMLILKVSSSVVVSDFRPISLIVAQYKIIAKVLRFISLRLRS